MNRRTIMVLFRSILLLLVSSITVMAQTQPNLVTFQSTETQAALLELYTSEGCSSCPPADLWLSGLKDKPGLWKDFVPVAFHVDYWDRLGWRDPWGSSQFSDRQRALAGRWRNDTIYTPGFALNGDEWRGWSGSDIPPSSKTKIGVLTAKSSNTLHWEVTFAPRKFGQAGYEATIALLGNGLRSNVKAGENSGRQLKHDFTVLNLTKAPLTRNGDRWGGQIVVKEPGKLEGSLGLAVWVTQVGQIEPLQATGGTLPDRVGR